MFSNILLGVLLSVPLIFGGGIEDSFTCLLPPALSLDSSLPACPGAQMQDLPLPLEGALGPDKLLSVVVYGQSPQMMCFESLL